MTFGLALKESCLPDGERDGCGGAFTDLGSDMCRGRAMEAHTFHQREKLAAGTVSNCSVDAAPRTASGLKWEGCVKILEKNLRPH